MKNFVIALSLFAGLVSPAPLALADTLHLASDGGQSVGGVDVYPYNFNVNGSSSLTTLMCLNFNREITFGETWNVTVGSIATDSSVSSTDFRADAWIYSQLGAYSNADVQYAVWDILDPTDVNGHAGFDSTAQTLATTGLQMAANQTLIASGFFSNYSVYQPTTDQTGWTMGTPQSFIGAAVKGVTPQSIPTAVTPEPSSLMLLGTGLVGVAGALRRRTARA